MYIPSMAQYLKSLNPYERLFDISVFQYLWNSFTFPCRTRTVVVTMHLRVALTTFIYPIHVPVIKHFSSSILNWKLLKIWFDNFLVRLISILTLRSFKDFKLNSGHFVSNDFRIFYVFKYALFELWIGIFGNAI